MRYNENVRELNRARQTFPTNVVAGLVGERFAEKAYLTRPSRVSQALGR